MSIRIAITDDHLMVQNGLQAMLPADPSIAVIATFSSGKELLAGLRQKSPDVLLLDLNLPDIAGIDLMNKIASLYPQLPVIVLTSVDNAYMIKAMLHAGAKGYVLKTTGIAELIIAIKTVADGNLFLSQEANELLAKHVLNQRGRIHIEELTERERSILQLITEGKTSHEIGEQLHLSGRTVENYRLGLMQKLDVKNIAELVKKSIFLGLIK